MYEAKLERSHPFVIIIIDLKPQNLLVDRFGQLKIADFGLARIFSLPVREYTHEVVTLWYRAPEVLLGQKIYTPALDVWSVGTIFAEMVNHSPLFPGDSEIDEIYKIFQLLGTPDDATWANVTSLPDFAPTFPKWKGKSLKSIFPTLDADGLDLITVRLTSLIFVCGYHHGTDVFILVAMFDL